MTNAQIIAAARNNLNATADTLWSDSELLLVLWRVGMDLARETNCMSQSFTTATVTGTSLYTAPPNAIEIVRVTYNGSKLSPLDYREYDSITPTATTSSGTPAYYIEHNGMLQLYPCPDDAQAVKILDKEFPDSPSTSGTITIPAKYHDVLVAGVTYEMAPKDLGHPLTLYWEKKWLDGVAKVKSKEKLAKRGDRFARVKTEEQMVTNEQGVI
jgi:hypothetical protein